MPLYDVLEVLMPNGVMGQAEPENYPAMVEKTRKNVEYALALPGDRPVLVFHSPRHTHDGCVRVEQGTARALLLRGLVRGRAALELVGARARCGEGERQHGADTRPLHLRHQRLKRVTPLASTM